jgi:hypothetical protein
MLDHEFALNLNSAARQKYEDRISVVEGNMIACRFGLENGADADHRGVVLVPLAGWTRS